MSSNTKHKSHILPLRVYFGVALALFVMTALTVEAASFNFGEWNIIIAMAIAIFKAALVALIFMHLFWDRKIYSAVFIGSILCLGIFITLTMFDTLKRDRIYTERSGAIVPQAVIYTTPDSTKATEGETGGEADSSAAVEDTLLEEDVEDTAAADEEDWQFE